MLHQRSTRQTPHLGAISLRLSAVRAHTHTHSLFLSRARSLAISRPLSLARDLTVSIYIHTYIHTYIHIYIHTYIHIHTYPYRPARRRREESQTQVLPVLQRQCQKRPRICQKRPSIDLHVLPRRCQERPPCLSLSLPPPSIGQRDLVELSGKKKNKKKQYGNN